MGTITNAIVFKRVGAVDNRLEVYTDATSATVDTQITAVTSNGTFTAGTFSGVVCEYAQSVTGCEVSNTLNNSTTKVFGGSRTKIWGTAPVSTDDSADIQPVVDTIALANGDNNNVAVEHSYNNIIGPTAGFAITGLSLSGGNVGGFTITFVNTTGQTLTLKHQSASSTAGNKLYNLSGADEALAGNSVVELTWDPAKNSWLTKFSDTGTTGTGNVTGPATSTDNAAARFDGATGKVLQNGVVLIGDTGAVTGVTDLTIGGALAGVTNITMTGSIASATTITADSIKVDNTGLTVEDTNASHVLTIKPGSDLTANRVLTVTTSDADRTIDLTGGNLTTSAAATIGGTNTGDQLLRSSVRASTNGTAIAQALTRYGALDGPIAAQATDPSDTANNIDEFVWVPPYNGTLRNLQVRVNAAPAAGQTFAITVMRNGVAGILTATVTDAGKTASDAVNSVSGSVGDRFVWRIVTSATSGNFNGTISAEWRAD